MSVDSIKRRIESAVRKLVPLQRRSGLLGAIPPKKLIESVLEDFDSVLRDMKGVEQHLVVKSHEVTATRRLLVLERVKYSQLFESLLDACLSTSADMRILEANRAAAEFLNVRKRSLVGKNLAMFLSSDRTRMLDEALRVAQARGRCEFVVEVRPRERAPVRTAMRVVAAADPLEGSLWWMLRRDERQTSSIHTDLAE
jgi:PAS domain S-box-containing protein